jgi:regulator of replication initiation timing
MIKIQIEQVIDEMKIILDRILRRDVNATNKKKKSKKSSKSNNVSIENLFVFRDVFSVCNRFYLV